MPYGVKSVSSFQKVTSRYANYPNIKHGIKIWEKAIHILLSPRKFYNP